MSDNILTLIPLSPDYLPDERARNSAEVFFRRMVPAADEVSSVVLDHPQLFDAGGNFEGVACPRCHADLDLGWWSEAMDRALAHQPHELDTVMPCCGASTSLNDLSYSWPQGFARYALAARNPQVRELSPGQMQELAEAVGSMVRPIWSHI